MNPYKVMQMMLEYVNDKILNDDCRSRFKISPDYREALIELQTALRKVMKFY